MARKPRIHLPGGYYHVMMRGNGGNDIFFCPADRTRFLLFVQQGIERYGHRVHAFCLMDNHVHLLIQVGAASLSKIMQNLGFRYTRFINHKRQSVGHLFQGRFKSILVDADSYLLELVRYIHLNPVRAGVCETAGKFEWSSHGAYIGRTAIPWLYTQELLGRFSQDENRARELYVDFVEQGMGEKRRKDFHHGSHLGQILGPDHFAEIALKASDKGIVKPKSIVEVLTVVCEVYGVEPKLMYEPGNGRPYSELRAMAALIIQDSEAITITSLAKELGRDLSALSKSAGRLRMRMRKDESLQEKHKRISDAVKMSICQA
jgi:REP element-mobilizing transposase RayT